MHRSEVRLSGEAVKEGLDRDTALRALTINPARIAGVDDRLGSIEAGKDADLVLWSGDPLDVFSRAQRALVGGREVYACHGVTSVENPLPVDPDTLFLLGSVTKTYTATALMRLAAEDRLALDAPARRYAYYLTPQGFAEKSRLTVRYLSDSFSFFRMAKSDCAHIFELAKARGFARLVLEATDDTRQSYPFDFRLDITYTLDGSTIRTEAKVQNRDAEPMPMQFGFHPGFAWPLPGWPFHSTT